MGPKNIEIKTLVMLCNAKEPQNNMGRNHWVMANVLGNDIVVRMFELQWCYYVHFQTNALVKDTCLSARG